MIDITSQGPVNRHITEYLTTDKRVRQYRCKTLQNPDYYRTPEGLFLPVNVGEIVAAKSNKGADMLLRGKGIISVGQTTKDDGYKFVGFRPDEVQDGSEQLEISLERVEIGGKVQTFDLSQKEAVSSITTRMGPLYIQSARQRTRVMVRADNRTDAIRLVLVIHTKGLNLVRMEAIDEFWFYSIRTGEFRFRLCSPYLLDLATMQPIGGDSPLPPMVRHSLTEIAPGEYRYVKETTDVFANKSDLPFPLLVDADTVYSTTADGIVYVINANFTTARSATSGSASNNGTVSDWYIACYSGYTFVRAFFYFPLTDLSGNVTAASQFIYGATARTLSSNCIMKGTQADTLVGGDYDSFSGDSYGYVAWNGAAYNEIVFNAQGCSDVQAALGLTFKTCSREYEHDYLNSSSGLGANAFKNGCYLADNTGFDKDPKMSITTVAATKAPIVRPNPMRHMLVR